MKPIALIYGASSTIAAAAMPKLQDLGYQVWGISRSATRPDFDRWFQVASYAAINLPKIDQPVAAMAFMPGSIQLKPFLRYRDEDFLNDMECNAFAAARCATATVDPQRDGRPSFMVFTRALS